jgi:hypothetical protein
VTHGEEVPRHEGVRSRVSGHCGTRSWWREEARRREESTAQGGAVAR